jgi:hypothetical protein
MVMMWIEEQQKLICIIEKGGLKNVQPREAVWFVQGDKECMHFTGKP